MKKMNLEKLSMKKASSTEKRKIKILDNFNIKIICFGLAVALYSFVSYIQSVEKAFPCELKVIGLNDSFVISNDIPSNVKITVKNKSNIIDKITENDFNLRLDLSDIDSPNEYQLKLLYDVPKAMHTFSNSNIFSSIMLDPEKVTVVVENLVEKNVPIILDYYGEVEKGYTVRKRTSDSYYVRAQGPERIINEVKFIKTEKINLEGETETFKRSVNLVAGNPLIKLIGKTKIDVTFEIVKLIESIRLSFTDVSVHNLKNNLKTKIEDINVTVQVSGARDDILKLNKENIILSVDFSKVNYPGEYSLRIDVGLPKNITLNQIKPEVIKVKVEQK